MANPLARDLLQAYYGTSPPATPEPVLQWLRRHVADVAVLTEPARLSIEAGSKRLTFRLHQQIGDSEGGDDWLIIMQEVSDETVIGAMSRIRQLHPHFEG